jgi:hypothetical protein
MQTDLFVTFCQTTGNHPSCRNTPNAIADDGRTHIHTHYPPITDFRLALIDQIGINQTRPVSIDSIISIQ